jgi:thiol-disulfide isomerase/thioredoxin/YHS domain-containing protein
MATVTWAGRDDKATCWHDSFAEAEALARQHQRPIVVHFYANWCGPCQTMERTVLSQTLTLEFLDSQVIGVKINSDHHRDLVGRFGVSSLPTDIFLNSQGKEVARTVGMQDLSVYLEKLRLLSSVAISATKKIHQVANPPLPTTNETPVQKTPNQFIDIVRLVPFERTAPPISQINHRRNQEPDSTTIALSTDVDNDGYRCGLGGFSPVALAIANAWKPGLAEFATEFKGVRYLLTSIEEVQLFNKNPDAYAPSLHGFDPVAMRDYQKLTVGKIAMSFYHEQRLFFFASEESRNTFRCDPARYSSVTDLQLFRPETKVASNDATN